jgi:O-methyltransferase
MSLLQEIRGFNNTKVDPTIINNEQLDQIVIHALDVIERGIEGDVVEFGCYVGESSKYLRKTLDVTKSNKDLYVYDSFEGLPPLSKHEEGMGWRPGTLNTTEEVLIKNFRDNGLKPPYTCKGWFKDVPDYRVPDKICFAFLDGDFYDSIYDSLTKIYDKVQEGGYILFHDYERNDLPGVRAAIEDFLRERGEEYNVYTACEQVGVLKKGASVEKPIVQKMEVLNKELTVVTGLWNIGRPGRNFDHYIEHFRKFLEMPVNMFIYIPKEYEYLVWEKRSKENTIVKIYELEDVKTLYKPFWERTQNIRTKEEWYNQTGESGWLRGSPQAALEWYNPIVQSKMFMLSDASIWDPFSSEYFIWLDAGITNTVWDGYFNTEKVLDKLNPYLDSFLFLSYPYETNSEIHGFNKQEIDRIANADVKYVCRGGLFGGRKEVIREANADYYNLLDNTLNRGLMGTEESVFSIMAHLNPHLYRRYELDGNGLISKFIQDLVDNKAELIPTPENRVKVKAYNPSLKNIKSSLYMLTFNFPQQVEHTLATWQASSPDWLEKPRKILIDNSNKQEAIEGNRAICEKYGFEHIITNENLGINRGRLLAAKHFQESDSDFYFFFEDDMGFNPSTDNGFCRNGFKNYVPNLYDNVHKIMIREGFDFMKLSFTEVYMDNNIQVSWYNVPQLIRTRDWPHYDKLPISGLDPNAPRTLFKHIDSYNGISFASGDVYYANWPMIVNREGNQKMFLDVDWAHPFEQTWMSYMYQETKEGKLNPAVLLASPVWHNRIVYYEDHERREN